MGEKRCLGRRSNERLGEFELNVQEEQKDFVLCLAMEGQTEPDTITRIIRCMNIRRPFSVARP